LSALDLDRHEVRPETPLETLIPRHRRREVWRQLRRQGVPVPGLELSDLERNLRALGVLKTAAAIALWLQEWSALLSALPLGLAEYGLSRRRAVHFPFGVRTVGELVLSMTDFTEHKSSGYRWTRNEITFKVRLTLAEALNVPLDAVRPDSTLAELGAE
jgi:hypothetical protein